MNIPEWLLPYLPALTGVLGVAISWALKSDSPLVGWFKSLNGWGKLGALAGIGVLYGAVLVLGFDQSVVSGGMQVLILLTGTQVGYVSKPAGDA